MSLRYARKYLFCICAKTEVLKRKKRDRTEKGQDQTGVLTL